MFGLGKKKKSKETDKTSENKQEEVVETPPEEVKTEKKDTKPVDVDLTPEQREKNEKLDSVKSKISKILQSKNIVIVDENAGDEYESTEGSDSEKQKQQDYDSLKAMFGKSGKDKKQELTLTIDDFDYSYVGKYVDEYDLIHMKNIKKIKLPNKHAKLIKKLVVIGIVLVFLTIGGITVYNVTKQKPVYLKSVSLSQNAQTYFQDEFFDYSGIYIYAEYSNGYVDKIKLEKKHFYNSKMYVKNDNDKLYFYLGGQNAVLYFNYEGFINEFDVTVLNKNESGITVKYTEGVFNLKQDDTLSENQLFVLLDYSNYQNSSKVPFSDISITVYDNESDYKAKHNGTLLERSSMDNSKFKITKKITDESIFVVTYKNYSVTLDRSTYSVSSN